MLIGLTLAVTDDFTTLFIVIIFHREFLLPLQFTPVTESVSSETFEGLGVGSRLAYMELPGKYHYAPYVGAFLYGICTPIGTCDVADRGVAVSLRVSTSGIAVGLGVRTTYNPDSTTASIVSGILDAFSAGILIYTGLVEVRLLLRGEDLRKLTAWLRSSLRMSSCSTGR